MKKGSPQCKNYLNFVNYDLNVRIVSFKKKFIFKEIQIMVAVQFNNKFY